MRSIKTLIIWLFFSLFTMHAAEVTLSPSNWWVGMKYNKVTILAENLPVGLRDVTISNSTVKITDHYSVKNKSFHFIEIEIPERITPHTLTFTFHFITSKPIIKEFAILPKAINTHETSLSQEDVIYQIMPDRFCNGDEDNDNIREYFEKSDRLNPASIHGGDLKGIANQLKYISDLGCTAIELLPVCESNLMLHSYERMAPTNLFAIDKRLGNINDYKKLAAQCKELNLKLIQSIVLNQVGKQHPWFKNMIDPSFFYTTEYDYATEKINMNILSDPFATESECEVERAKWEKYNYPSIDLNNEIIQKLMTQYMLWWIESTQVKIWKIEQANRNTPSFLSKLSKAIKDDYPEALIIYDNQSPNNITSDQTASNYTVDYQYPTILADAFSTFRDHNEGVSDLYNYALSYSVNNQKNTITLLDNYLLNRAYTNADIEIDQLTMMLGHLITSPGIPCLNYGTEWLVKGNTRSNLSDVRKDFPGGWNSDSANGFSGEGMTQTQSNFYKQVKILLNWRKQNTEIFTGTFKHLYPKNNIYTFIRYSDEKVLLVVFNNSEKETYRLNSSLYTSLVDEYQWCSEIISGNRFKNYQDIITQPKSISIIELTK